MPNLRAVVVLAELLFELGVTDDCKELSKRNLDDHAVGLMRVLAYPLDRFIQTLWYANSALYCYGYSCSSSIHRLLN